MDNYKWLCGLEANSVCRVGLLADAEFREDVVQDFVGGDGAAAGDGAEGGDDGADLLGEEVGGQGVEACDGAVEGRAGIGEGLEMAAVGNDGGAVEKGGGVDAVADGAA